MTKRQNKRAGGRAARLVLRAAPLADDIRPIRAGMTGGRYRPLTDQDIQRIHEAAPALFEDGVENLLLVLEVVVDEAVRDARIAGDVGDARAVIAQTREDANRGVENQRPLVGAHALAVLLG